MSAYAKDLLERAAVTFVQTLVASVALTEVTDTAMWAAAAVAGLSAALSVVKSALASQVGRTDSASLSRTV